MWVDQQLGKIEAHEGDSPKVLLMPKKILDVCIKKWHIFTNVSTRVQGHRGGLGWGVGTPPLFWGPKTQKNMF